MKKQGYPPLDDQDKIVDPLPGGDPDALESGERAFLDGPRRSVPIKAKRKRRVAPVLLSFLIGVGAGWFLHGHLSQGGTGSPSVPSVSGWLGYPLAGITLEKASRGDARRERASAVLLRPGERVSFKYGKESLRLLSMERRSSPLAAFQALMFRPPVLYLEERAIEIGQDISSLVEPEMSLSYTLVVKASRDLPPLASFGLELEMDAQAWLARAQGLKDFEAKKRSLEKALEASPEEVELLMALGNLLAQHKEGNAAAEMFQQVLKKEPHHVEAAKALCAIYVKVQPKKALEMYETLVKIDSGNRLSHYKEMARLQERLGLSPAETYRKILAIQRNDPDAVRGLDTLYARHIEKAQEWEKKGELPKAIQEMKLAMEFQATKETKSYLATLYSNLGFSLAQKGKLQEAISHYEASLKLDENPITYLNLADAYAKNNRVDDSLKAVEKAYGLKPKEAGVLRNILLLWGELLMAKKDYQHAIQKLEELHARAPKDPQLLKTLGLAYWKKGDLAKALGILKEIPPLVASGHKKEQAEVHRLIGDLQRAIGDQEKDLKRRISRYDEALKSYKQALALDKDKEVQKRMDELAEERKALQIRAFRSS
ncbi:MAG: tetratricopeptide repeat protein [Thermodesulfobacteriota bacterium]